MQPIVLYDECVAILNAQKGKPRRATSGLAQPRKVSGQKGLHITSSRIKRELKAHADRVIDLAPPDPNRLRTRHAPPEASVHASARINVSA
jgi:hypothetical protein